MKDSSKNRRALTYLGLTGKKGILLLPRFFMTLVVTAAVLAVSTLALYAVSQRVQILPRIQVAVVILDGDLATGLSARAIGEMDSVKSICEFQYLDSEEADAALRNGDIHAAIYLTEDIYHDIDQGINTPIRVRISKDSGLGVQLFRDLLNIALSMVQVGEATVYALDDITDIYELKGSFRELIDGMTANFIALAFNRNGVWVDSVLSPYGNITMTGYYVMMIILAIVCIFFGIGFASLYNQKERVVDQCLQREGVGVFFRGGARILTMTVVLYLLLALIFVVLLFFPSVADIHPVVLVQLLPLAFSLAAFIHLIYSFASGESGSLIYLIITLLLFILGGGLVPPAFLPGFLPKISGFLPLHIWQKYFSDLLWNGFSLSSMGSVLLLGLLMAAAGNAGLKYNESKS